MKNGLKDQEVHFLRHLVCLSWALLGCVLILLDQEKYVTNHTGAGAGDDFNIDVVLLYSSSKMNLPIKWWEMFVQV